MLDSRPIAELWSLCESVIAAGGYFRLWPRGRSMLPLLREGRDSVLLSRAESLSVGDVVLARTEEGHFYLHRIIALDSESVTLAGDAQLTVEGPMPRTCVLARAVRIFRGEKELDPTTGRMRAYAYHRAIRRTVLKAIKRTLGNK